MDRSLLPKMKTTYFTPDGKLSTRTPKTDRNGESQPPQAPEPSSQPVDVKQVAKRTTDGDAANCQHCVQVGGEAGATVEETVADASVPGATSPSETPYDALADLNAASGSPTAGHDAPGDVLTDVGHPSDQDLSDQQSSEDQTTAPTGRRNTQKLSVSEQDRFLLCLSYGMSLRQAGAAVGCHYSTLVKRAKRDPALKRAIQSARQKARTDPLIAVQQASKRSWRAAAWLLTYLERRDDRGRPKE